MSKQMILSKKQNGTGTKFGPFSTQKTRQQVHMHSPQIHEEEKYFKDTHQEIFGGSLWWNTMEEKKEWTSRFGSTGL